MAYRVSCGEKETARRPVLLTVRRAVLCLLRNYASVCLLWQLLDLLSYDPPEKRYALTAGAVTFLAVMIFLVAGLDQLTPGQWTHDTVHTQTVGLLERQHGGLCLASEDAVHAAAVKSSRFRIGATVTPNGETHYEIRAPDIDVTVNPAAGDSLDTVALTLPYADTGKHAYTPDWSKLPSGQT